MKIDIKELGDLASYTVFGEFSPAITKEEGGYSIRILKAVRRTLNMRQVEWEHFFTDLDGIITKSPYGWGKKFNKKQIKDIEKEYKKYENKRINHF